jgi:hypothetical protein
LRSALPSHHYLFRTTTTEKHSVPDTHIRTTGIICL